MVIRLKVQTWAYRRCLQTSSSVMWIVLSRPKPIHMKQPSEGVRRYMGGPCTGQEVFGLDWKCSSTPARSKSEIE